MDIDQETIKILDIDQETIKITGRTILSNEQRQHLFEERVTALNNRLKIQREKIDKKNETSDNCTENTDEEAVGKKRKSEEKTTTSRRKSARIDMPKPDFLVGKRVEHLFFVQEKGKTRRQRQVFTGTVLNIVRDAIDPLYTLYCIRYDVDDIINDNDDNEEEEEIQTDFMYELLVDYLNSNLTHDNSGWRIFGN